MGIVSGMLVPVLTIAGLLLSSTYAVVHARGGARLVFVVPLSALGLVLLWLLGVGVVDPANHGCVGSARKGLFCPEPWPLVVRLHVWVIYDWVYLLIVLPFVSTVGLIASVILHHRRAAGG